MVLHTSRDKALLLPEAQWQPDGEVVPLPPPTDEAVLARVLRQAKKDWAELDAAWAEDEYEELQQRAIQEQLGLADAHRPRARAQARCAAGLLTARRHRSARA